MEAYTLAKFLEDAGTFVTEAIGWVGQVVEVIVSNPLTLVGALIPLSGLGIGLYRRLRG